VGREPKGEAKQQAAGVRIERWLKRERMRRKKSTTSIIKNIKKQNI